MANDNSVIGYVTPAALVELMRQTGQITVHETVMADGKPTIHAALRVVNARTGEQLPGGLPFSVVMFKQSNEPGYSNIAIGTIIPMAELDIRLPRDYFNFCNQRLRFIRVFPLDERSFVVQMDLILHNATREYVKFNLGLWGALFSQVLYELIGRGRESLVQAAEAYAATDVASHYVSTVTASSEAVPADAHIETLPEAAIVPPEVEAEPMPELASVEIVSVETLSPEPTPEPASEPETVIPEPEGPFSPLGAAPVVELEPDLHERLLRMAEPAEGKEMIEIETDVPGHIPAETAKPALATV